MGVGVNDARPEMTELMMAASRGDYPTAERLVNACDVNARDQFGNTALIYAAAGGHAEVLRLLLRAGADPALRNEADADALERATSAGHGDAAALLLSAGSAALQGRVLTGADRRLLEACWDGDCGGAEELIACGASDEARDPGSGWTPLVAACARGHARLVVLLLSRGADPEARVAGGRAALHFASELGDAGVVELLLASGADPDPRDYAGVTPLMMAARDSSEEVIRALVARGSSPALTNPSGESATDIARLAGGGRALDLLLSHSSLLPGGGEEGG